MFLEYSRECSFRIIQNVEYYKNADHSERLQNIQEKLQTL